LGSSLPPAELARRDSALFGEVKCLFSTAPEVEKKRRRTEVTVVTGRCTGHGHGVTGRVRSVFSVCAYFSLMIGCEARPVTVDQTRPVVQGAYWTPTGRGHCGVRSVLQRVRSLVRCARLRVDQRVRSVTGPVRPVVTGASGRCDRRVRSVLRETSRCATGASGQLDQRVWST
jgi:hypothetical protein